MGTPAGSVERPAAGAVASLVLRYLEARGRSKRSVARALGVDVSKVYAITKGYTSQGNRYLGGQRRGDVALSFLGRLAEELAIPEDELLRAHALDVGLIRTVLPPVESPSSLQGRYLHDPSFAVFSQNGDVIPIDRAASRRQRRLWVNGRRLA